MTGRTGRLVCWFDRNANAIAIYGATVLMFLACWSVT